MSATLATKLRRDIARQRTAFIAVAVTVALGVALFGAAYDAYRNLDASYGLVFDELSVPDVWLVGGDTTAIAEAVADVDGVATVATRTQVDLPLQVGTDKLSGRLVGLPTDPALAEATVRQGDAPADGAVLVDHHLADALDVAPGGTVQVRTAEGWTDLDVSGVAASAEYLWLVASRQEVIALPDEFGVLLAPQETVAAVTGTAPNQVLVRLEDGVARDDLAPVLERIARDHDATDTWTWDTQPSNAALQEDISGFSQMALLLPLLFLTAAAMASYTLLSRRIHAERAVIGMLRAQGVSGRRVARHYLGHGLVAGLGGAVPGVLAGLWLARTMTDFYVGFLDLPFTAVALHAETPVIGLAFGALAGGLAAWGPARAAGRTSPAEAMRGVVPVTGGRVSLLERAVPFADRLPASGRLVLRSIDRNRRRTAMTAGGVMLSLLLVLVSWSILDTVTGNLDAQFGERDRSDITVALLPGSVDALAQVRAVDGVAVAEPTTQLPVTITGPDGSYATVLQALPTDTTLRTFDVVEGDVDGLPDDGLLAGAALRDQVGAGPGDQVRLTLGGPAGEGATTVEAPLAGLVQEPLGTMAYTTLEGLGALVGQDVPTTGVLVGVEEGADIDAVRADLEALDVVASTQTASALRDLIDDVSGLLVGFVTIMLVCGGTLAATMILTTMSVAIAERTREVATLRASGVATRRIARLVTIENLVVALLGVVPGVVLGILGGKAMMATYTTDQLAFTFMVAPTTVVVSVLAILAVAAASQVPGLRSLGRLDLARTVRERAA